MLTCPARARSGCASIAGSDLRLCVERNGFAVSDADKMQLINEINFDANQRAKVFENMILKPIPMIPVIYFRPININRRLDMKKVIRRLLGQSREGALRKKMQAVLKELDYDFSQFTMESFVAWLEEEKEREIELIPWQVPPLMSGAWISTPERHYIFYDEAAPPVLREHIQLNHLARIILGHETLEIDSQVRLLDEVDVEQIAFRGEFNESSKQTLLEMVKYVLRAAK